MMLKSQSHKVTKSQDKIKNLVFIFLTCVVCLVTCDLFAQSLSSSELINNAKRYDGQTVVYEGEVIGDVMKRGDFIWVNLNDGKNAIGIWLPKSLGSQISYTGRYNVKGDWLKVSGVFHRACPQHGGDLDIHGQEVIKTSEGKIIFEKLNLQKVKLFLILLGALLCLVILKTLKTGQSKT